MKISNATSYIKELTTALATTQTSDASGKPLTLDAAVDKAVEMILAKKSKDNKVMLVGNGGSSAIVSHAHNDLCKMVGIKALVFHETPLLTALSNDLSYSVAFEKLVEMWGQAGDILIAVSSSGGSENILRATRAAKKKKCDVITYSGFKPDNPLRSLGDINFYVKADQYGFVEASHMALLHLLTDKSSAS
jgi:D-sedoheptulose 7-phosphate isomerase